MTIFRKELRTGAVSFLVWSAVVGGLMAVCVGLYPSMAGSMEDMSALFAGMGDFSAAFGLDKLGFGSILGFYGTECWRARRGATRRNSSSPTRSAASRSRGKSWRPWPSWWPG